MMSDGIAGELTTEPIVDLAAMAQIVRGLVAGGAALQRDGRWLRERAAAADLSAQACQALEAVRLKLCSAGAALLDEAAIKAWT